ncbi:hypothetical protein [Afipia sp. Root123D2]|uniref:hypothetical protein n=1 Tax=Afipia sp. Root123D2 TaxID=1736436 RepID=UPI0012E80B64|nr:hypothetical protein [Afipia sp. Root123D2]
MIAIQGRLDTTESHCQSRKNEFQIHIFHIFSNSRLSKDDSTGQEMNAIPDPPAADVQAANTMDCPPLRILIRPLRTAGRSAFRADKETP